MRPLKKDDLPSLTSQSNWKSMPSDPIELFVLSNINGTNTIGTIANLCGKSISDTISIIRSLIKTAIVSIDGVSIKKEQSKSSNSDNNNIEYSIKREYLVPDENVDFSICSPNYDLSIERQREIALLSASIDNLNPFQIFEADEKSTDRDIKRKYQKLTLKFHPDRFYGKNIGSLNEHIRKIFTLISDCYELIQTEENRNKLIPIYRDSLSKQPVEITPPQYPQDSSKEKSQKRRSRIKNRLKKLTSEIKTTSYDTKEKTPVPSPISNDKLRKRKHSHRKKFISLGIKERINKAKEHFNEGKKCFENENWTGASSHLNMALSLDPNNSDIIKLHKIANEKANNHMFAIYQNKAKMEKDLNNFERSAKLYALASEVSTSPDSAMEAAKCFSKIDDHAKAKEYALLAIERSNHSLNSEILLSQIYINAELYNRARTILNEIILNHPGNKEAKRMLNNIKNK